MSLSPSTPILAPVIDVHLHPSDLRAALLDDVRRGLTSSPRTLPPKWFYDDRGSELFDEITRLPEYYPTARERAILQAQAATIAARSGADTLVELGSGTSDKTRTLLDAFAASGQLRRFVPFDVSEGVLRWSASHLAERYAGLEVHGVVGDFDHHLGSIPAGGRRLVAFLGGTIGNYEPADRARLLGDLASTVLRVLDRELHADFDPLRWQHRAVWDAEQEWIEMRLRAVGRQAVEIDDLGLALVFSDGEEIRTEI